MTGPQYSPAELLNIYNNVVQRHGLPPKHLSKKGYAAMAVFGQWCRTNDVDPVAFIRARHEQMGWRYPIPIEKLAYGKGVPAFLAKFKEWGERKQSHALSQERIGDHVVTDTPLWGNELRHLGEVMKRQLRLDPEACLLNMDLTGGWNPRSPICSDCPVAETCAASLPAGVLRGRYVGSE
jgi:hypothetical protein